MMSEEATPGCADGAGQHYESFVWRLLLDEEGVIRSISVQHVQTGEVKRWGCWNRDGLLDFVEARAVAARRPGDAPAAGVPPPARQGSDQERARRERPRAEYRRPERPGEQQAHVPGRMTGTLCVERTAVLPFRPLTLTVALDLSSVADPNGRLAYDAAVVARRFADDARVLVARASGMLDPVHPTLLISGEGLAAGMYRLEAAVVLRDPEGHQRAAALTEGVLLEVPLPGEHASG